MSGADAYVWSAYGLAALVVGGLALQALLAHARARARLLKAAQSQGESR